MKDVNFVSGLFLIAIAALFGGVSLTYNIGEFSQAGPGLFPLVISILLLLIGIATVVRSRLVPSVPIDYRFKNITLVLASLVGFVVLSEFVNMVLGIAFLVFCSSYAAKTPSWQRSLKITIGLVIIAFMFRNLLGLNLPLLIFFGS
jgi:hypothetical protein